MTTASRPTLLPTSVVGGHGLPGWVWLAREAMAAGRLGARDLRELTEDATQVALLDQERAGVDVLTTGEMGRVRSSWSSPTAGSTSRPAGKTGPRTSSSAPA